MKHLKRRSSAAAIFALAALMSSCSFLHLSNDVAVKAVPIDLTFGASIPPTTAPLQPPPAIIVPPPVPTLPPLPTPPPVPTPPPEPVFACPEHPTALGARDPSTPDITPDEAPKEGVYLYRFQGQYGGPNAGLSTIIGYKTVSNVQTVDATLGSFTFQVEDPFNHIVLVLLAKPISSTDPLDGLFLQEIDIPSANLAMTDPLKFIPAQPLRMIDFPIQPGTNQTLAAIDTGQKPSSAPGGVLPPLPSADTITSNFTVGAAESVDVCADIAKAYKGNWELKITGQYNADLAGTFWIDTAYGGLPVKDDFTLTSDTLETGNFSSNLMRLDPVKFI